MTDKQKLMALLDEFGVTYIVDTYRTPSSITIDSDSTKTVGYGFFTMFEFDSEGKFIQVGLWE